VRGRYYYPLGIGNGSNPQDAAMPCHGLRPMQAIAAAAASIPEVGAPNMPVHVSEVCLAQRCAGPPVRVPSCRAFMPPNRWTTPPPSLGGSRCSPASSLGVDSWAGHGQVSWSVRRPPFVRSTDMGWGTESTQDPSMQQRPRWSRITGCGVGTLAARHSSREPTAGRPAGGSAAY